MPKHKGMRHGDPDRGPPMLEGAHHWDKGYTSDNEYFAPQGVYPDDHQRGNAYMEHQNEICHRDSKKLNREKFTKIA
jgi:hypothetical protein